MSAQPDQSMMIFRPMLEEDLPGIMRVENASYEFPWSETIFRDCLRVGYCSWILEIADEIVGHGVMSVLAGEAHILNLCVHPDSQNSGLGKEMLSHLLHLAGQHAAEIIFLEVRPSNAVAIQLYNRAGFDEVGLRSNYYPAVNGREDAVIMAKNIANGKMFSG